MKNSNYVDNIPKDMTKDNLSAGSTNNAIDKAIDAIVERAEPDKVKEEGLSKDTIFINDIVEVEFVEIKFTDDKSSE